LELGYAKIVANRKAYPIIDLAHFRRVSEKTINTHLTTPLDVAISNFTSSHRV